MARARGLPEWRRQYGVALAASGRNPRQRFSPIWADFGAAAFASACHRLHPLGARRPLLGTGLGDEPIKRGEACEVQPFLIAARCLFANRGRWLRVRAATRRSVGADRWVSRLRTVLLA